MYTQLISLVLLVFTLITASPAAGDLPRGAPIKSTEPTTSQTTTEPVPVTLAEISNNCWEYLFNPLGGEGIFASDSGDFYFLVRQSQKTPDKKPASSKALENYDYKLYKVIVTQKGVNARPLFGLTSGINVSLVPHGTNISAISLTTFTDGILGCSQGNAFAITVPIPSDTVQDSKIVNLNPSRALPKGNYKVVSGTTGSYYFDFMKDSIKEFGADSLQIRTASRTEAGELPLFLNMANKTIYSYVPQPAPAVLKRSRPNVPELNASKIEIKENTKILQQGSAFALGKMNLSSNSISILPAFHTESVDIATNSNYQIKLPKIYKVQDAAVAINFVQNRALVFNNKRPEAKKWDRIFVVNYTNGKTVSEFAVKPEKYCSSVTISHDTKYAMVVLQQRSNNDFDSLLMYDFKTNKWSKIDVAIPEVMKPSVK